MSKTYIDLDKLILDDRYRVRGVNENNLTSLINSDPDDWPSLKVKPQKDHMGRFTGNYIVLGGNHRVQAAYELQLDSLPCEIQDSWLTDEQALLLAYEDNADHGAPLTTHEKREYARLLKQHYPMLSYREIARRVHLDDHTVRRAIEGPYEYESKYDMPGKGIHPYQPSQAQAVVNVLQTILSSETYHNLTTLNSSTISEIASQAIRGGVQDVEERRVVAKHLSEIASGLKTASLRISRDK